MKLYTFILVATLVSGVVVANHVEEEDSLAKRSVMAGLGIASLVLNGLASFFGSINGSNNVKDTVIYGRAIRIHVPKDSNCAEVTDRESGYKSTKCADNAADAAAQASEELFDILIRFKFIDTDSLHHKPDVVTSPPKHCMDRLPTCDKRVKMGHCDPKSAFFHYMHDNCYRTCGGCQSLEAIKAALQHQANSIVAGQAGAQQAP